MNKLVTSLVMGACATLLAVAAPVASAQSNWENSTFTVTEPLDVGGFVLPPGTYLIKVVMLQSNRNTIQVTNTEQTKVFANVLCTPHPIREGEVIPSSRYIYYSDSAGRPTALRTWFARDTPNGQDIVYPKRRAMELAAAAKQPVIAIPDEVKEAQYETAPITVVTPELEVKSYEAPAPTIIAEAVPAKKLPKTASHVPLVALLGFVSLGGALGLRTLISRT